MLKRGDIKILIIEDDKFLRDLLVGKLEKEGYKVFIGEDGLKGLAAARETPPHLVLLDLVLPGLNGFEVLSRLRDEKIPVIVVSNLGSPEDIERAKSLGAKDFLVKAHNTPNEIVERVKKVLEDSYLAR
ncbi:MAG: response regulator [Candidatus Ryanbacteria bacterium]|nr:response regulator [Candidatus Ryanbacteria bacterium]